MLFTKTTPTVVNVGGTQSFPRETLMCSSFLSSSEQPPFATAGRDRLFSPCLLGFLGYPQPLLKRSLSMSYFWSFILVCQWHSGSGAIWLLGGARSRSPRNMGRGYLALPRAPALTLRSRCCCSPAQLSWGSSGIDIAPPLIVWLYSAAFGVTFLLLTI